jgi:hypothetical protein
MSVTVALFSSRPAHLFSTRKLLLAVRLCFPCDTTKPKVPKKGVAQLHSGWVNNPAGNHVI